MKGLFDQDKTDETQVRQFEEELGFFVMGGWGGGCTKELQTAGIPKTVGQPSRGNVSLGGLRRSKKLKHSKKQRESKGCGKKKLNSV